MQFSARLSFSLLAFVLVALLPQPAPGQVSSPRRFRAKSLSDSTLLVSWKEPKGSFESYKVAYSSSAGGEQREVQVSKQEAKLLIEDFDPSKEYSFKIFAVSGNQQSKPLQAKHEAQRSAVEMVQSQRTPDGGGGAEENNEISEGKKQEANLVKRNRLTRPRRRPDSRPDLVKQEPRKSCFESPCRGDKPSVLEKSPGDGERGK